MVVTFGQGLRLQYRPVEVLPPALRLAIQALAEREKALAPQAPVSTAVKGTSSPSARSA